MPFTAALIVTRPREQAQQWVLDLRSRGVAAGAVPLLDIAPPAHPEPVRRAWDALAEFRAVVFVSPNAVIRFFGAQHDRGRGPHEGQDPNRNPAGHWPQGTWAAAPGRGTAQALIDHGVPPGSILQPPADAGQFDSESLWPVMRALPWSGERVLLVRGEGGREWLSEQLQEAGAQVQAVSAYRRAAPDLMAHEQGWLQASLRDPGSAVWLFSSSEGLEHLPECAQRLWPAGTARSVADWAREVMALATHPRIAERARSLGFARTATCRPTLDDVVAAYRSIQSRAP